jgi:hypothetical protein
MQTRKRFKEVLLSLAAGHSMVPFGDNGPAIQRLSQRIADLRAEQGADVARRAQAAPRRFGSREQGVEC